MDFEKMDPEEREALIAEARKPPVRNAEEESQVIETIRHTAEDRCSVFEIETTKHFTIGIYGEESQVCAEAVAQHWKYVITPLSGDGSDRLRPITLQKCVPGKLHIIEEPEINLSNMAEG